MFSFFVLCVLPLSLIKEDGRTKKDRHIGGGCPILLALMLPAAVVALTHRLMTGVRSAAAPSASTEAAPALFAVPVSFHSLGCAAAAPPIASALPHAAAVPAL